MRDSRFIELLNLYVDHQLSAAEAAELEAELQRNGTRRKTYQQYCRIQRGCSVLFEKERSLAPVKSRLAAALADAEGKIVAFPEERPSRRRAYLSLGTAAAAACFAVVIVTRNSTSRSDVVTINGAPLAAAVAVETAEPVAQIVAIPEAENRSRPAGAARASFYSVFPARESADFGRYTNAFDVMSRPRDFDGDVWMREVELSPVTELTDARLTLHTNAQPAVESRVLHSRNPVQGAANEMSAFQFQR